MKMEPKEEKLFERLRIVDNGFCTASRYAEPHFSSLKHDLTTTLDELKQVVPKYQIYIEGLEKFVLKVEPEINDKNYKFCYKEISSYIDSVIDVIATYR